MSKCPSISRLNRGIVVDWLFGVIFLIKPNKHI